MFNQCSKSITSNLVISYFVAKNRSFSSLFNVQSKSINFKVGHFSPKYQGYSRTFGQKSLIVITFQCSIKINQFHFSPKYRGYSLTFWPKIAHFQNTKAIALLFGHFSPKYQGKHRSFSSLFNVQSKSINFKVGHFSPKYQGYSLTVWPQIAHFHHFSMFNQNQSISNLVICHQNTKAIALLSGQKSLIFITFQCSIKINQFQIWSFVTKIPRL